MYRLRWRAMMSVVTLVAAGSIVAALPATPAFADPGCQQGGAYVLWARGSGQGFDDAEARAFHDHTRYALQAAGFSGVAWAELGNLNGDFDRQDDLDPGEYPAVPVTDWHVLPPFYGSSVQTGTDELVAHLNHRYGTATGNWVSNCMQETLVLGGFSQGADVVGWALERDGGGGYSALSQSAKDHIGYVGLYGDPKRHGISTYCADTLWWTRGSPESCRSDGVLGPRLPYARPYLTSRLGSWCDGGDHLCNGYVPPGNHGTVYHDWWIWQSAGEIAAGARRKQCSLNPNMCPGTRMLGDVNGDGKSDAVVMFRDSGAAMVALSTGSSFGAPGGWSYGHSVGADRYFLADVNGDGRDDLVAFYGASGRWRVSLSSGGGFWPDTEWAYGHGAGTHNQLVADVTGDHRADLVTYDGVNGDWWVSGSSGSGFWPPSRWISGHGVGSSGQQVADFNGDGRQDAAIYVAGSGNWYVALSTGNNFGYPGQWSTGHGLGSRVQLAGDASGDGMADTVSFWVNDGRWQTGKSSGSGFWPPTNWAIDHGRGTVEQFLADATGDGRADLMLYLNGVWWVSPSDGNGFQGPSQLWRTGHGAGS